MFGNNAFGALGVEESQQAGPSRKQIQGEEIDVDVCHTARNLLIKSSSRKWLQLVKTNHDVNVRVSDKVNLEGLPLECNLMAVSNRYGVLLVGSNNGL
jgi:nucleoporin NUP159